MLAHTQVRCYYKYIEMSKTKEKEEIKMTVELLDVYDEDIIAGYKNLHGVNDTYNMIKSGLNNGTFENLQVKFEYIEEYIEDEDKKVEMDVAEYKNRIADGADKSNFTMYANVSWDDSSDISGNEIPADYEKIAIVGSDIQDYIK